MTSWAHIWCVSSFVLKTGCYNEEHNHLLYVLKASHDELKLAHEELSVAHDNLVKDHVFLTKELSNGKTKLVKAHHMGQLINHILLLTLVM